MAKRDFFDLVRMALPEDVDAEATKALAPDAFWQKDPYLAACCALARSPRINWDAYLRNNPDLAEAQVDPVEHFLRHGIYEGRKLASWHPLKKPEKEGQPLVSLVISIYNNDTHLDKCLDSAVNQTLPDIEILAIDDASTDRSPEIIEKYCRNDPRVIHVRLPENGGIFKSRKKGVNLATGRYVMFMDGDDFLDSRACEIAFKEISKGYDIVEGGANIINAGMADKDALWNFDCAINNAPEQEYFYSEIAQAIFVSGGLVWPLWSKIYLRELCLNAYNELPDGYFLAGEDGYALLGISRLARNAKKIKYRWYNYNFGPGLSTTTDIAANYDLCMAHGYAVKAMAEYAKKHSLDIKAEAMLLRHCLRAIKNWLEGAPEAQASKYFDVIIDQFGLKRVLATLVEHFHDKIDKLADKLQPRFRALTDKAKNPAKIGVFCSKQSRKLAKSYLPELVNYIQQSGREATLFIEGDPGCLPEDFPDVATVYLEHGGARTGLFSHLDTLIESLAQNAPDLMLYIDTRLPYAFFDLLALAEYKTPTVVLYMDSFCHPFIFSKNPYQHHSQEAAYRCAQAVACLTRPTELFLSQQGVNARYCGFPVAVSGNTQEGKEYDLAVIGDFADPNMQLNKTLLILREVAYKIPSASMVFIGEFANAEQREKFFALAKDYGIGANIHVTGKTKIGDQILAKAKILLSTLYIDSFGFTAARALSLGLPCVAYDLPVELFEHNQSLIAVPQGSVRQAAEAIVDLLSDAEKLRQTSEDAQNSLAAFNSQSYFANLERIISGQDAENKDWSIQDFKRVILYSAWYSERPRPTEVI